jgi:2-polyprenyl-3-methyl-5-hydroxy-6-metoxy-1,4-benzoquinol methylase
LAAHLAGRVLLEYDAVIESNITVHQKEADYYDFIHNEIWNKQEQKRLNQLLRTLTLQVENQAFTALDFGAGTGNITQKLLSLGYTVTAVDISPDMCRKLSQKQAAMIKRRRLRVLNINLDKTDLQGQYDLVAGYSVIHHLPNYLKTIEKLANLVKYGGILFFDHEPPPQTSAYQFNRTLGNAVLRAHYFVDGKINSAYLKLKHAKLPKIDYQKADVHTRLDWQGITQLLNQLGFIVQVTPHYVDDTRFSTPLSYLRKKILRANSAMLIAKKTDR